MVLFPNQNRNTGCTNNIVVKPVEFLGSTVLSFNASLGVGPTQESTLTVELVNDCKISGADDSNAFPKGDYFYGAARLGSPVFFDTSPAIGLPSGSSGTFQFGGILTSYTANQSAGGLTYNAKVVDPRSLLENSIIIVDSYLNGPIKHRNYFNVYAYYEYNILPTGLKENYPIPTGLTKSPYDSDDLHASISGAKISAGSTDILFPAGSWNKSDCSVFGTADSNDRGMSGRKVVQALKNLKPFIYSPNYGEPYTPNLTGKDIIAAGGLLFHERNVFKLDMTNFPEPPPYYRVSGPSISILQLLTDICDLRGLEFTIGLTKGDGGDPPIITIKTKKPVDAKLNQIKSTILDFDGRATELSYGEELRLEKNRTILVGEQQHNLYESASPLISHYFGEDSDGNPIVPVYQQQCGFEILIEPDKINAMLSCPLFDPDKHSLNIPLSEKILKRRMVISELDIRTALSSNELWKARVGASSVPDSDIKTNYSTLNSNTIDFNKVITYNFNDILSPLLSEMFLTFGILNSTPLVSATEKFTKEGGFKAIVDASHAYNAASLQSLNKRKGKDLETVYDWLRNLGQTYYGKQYLVYMPSGICSIPAGLYDEEYFGLGTGLIADAYPKNYIPNKCSGEITENSPLLSGKIYRDTLYSYVPTNAGGWVEPCTSVLGLYEPELSFFKAEDFRVQSFARFDTKDVKIHYTNNLMIDVDVAPTQETVDNAIGPDYNVNINRVPLFEDSSTYGGVKTAYTGTESITVIKGSCGSLDISLINADDYLMIKTSGGNCSLPQNSGKVPTIFGSGGGLIPYEVIDAVATTGYTDTSVWVKANVEEKIYIYNPCAFGVISTGVIPWQSGNPYADNYLFPGTPAPREYYYDPAYPTSGCDNYPAVVMSFSSPCYKKKCENDANITVAQLFQAYANLLEAKFPFHWKYVAVSSLSIDNDYQQIFTSGIKIGLISVSASGTAIVTSSAYSSGNKITQIELNNFSGIALTPSSSGTFIIMKTDGRIIGAGADIASRLLDPLQKIPSVCGYPIPTGTDDYINSLDLSSLNNKGFCPPAEFPTAVCIPLKSNILSYGPWYSPNFKTSAGGIEFVKDNELNPWSYGSKPLMAHIAKELVKEAQIALSETETGGITHPGMPVLSLGFLDNGPNLTNINVSFGGNGVTSNYVFQSYTPRFGSLKNLQNQQLKESYKNRQKAQKILKDRIIQENKILRKVTPVSNNGNNTPNPKPKLNDQGTLQRVMVGQSYDFGLIRNSGNQIIGSGQRTVVGVETLEKSTLEQRVGYAQKAFMSLDGFFSPISLSGDGGLPMFSVRYTGFPDAAKSVSLAPNPPVKIINNTSTDIKINQQYLNPLTNNFSISGHYHLGSGAGHSIDLVGRGNQVPGTGMIMSFYGQKEWNNRYTPDYRFLGLKGPLVLQAWGYDTQGKPIPNAVDDINAIKQSGTFATSGLKDYFYQDWLQKPASWPVAPIDLRFDRERGVWVSPPQHKIVVAQVTEGIRPYNSGSGVLINQYGSGVYGPPIYNASGVLVKAFGDESEASIIIEDRIGASLTKGQKGYAYFDSFSSKYLLLGGGGSPIRIGRFNGFWSNSMGRNIKSVKLYVQNPDHLDDPFNWIQETDENNNPLTATVLNLFAYIPSKGNSDRELWCYITPIGGSGSYLDPYLNAVKEYNQLWLLLGAEV